MIRLLMTRLFLLGAVSVMVCSLSAASWTRAEYDLVLGIHSEASAQKRLALLDQWKSQFPASEVRQQRRELYLATYLSIGDSARMLEVAREMLGEQPDNLVGAYWCTVLVPGGGNSPELLAVGEAAARLLLGRNQKEPPGTALLARRALGWIHWQRAEYPKAESEFNAYLSEDPTNAEISAWLGMVLAARKQPERIGPAFWRLAYAVSRRDAGALPETARRQVDSVLQTLYLSHHGAADGLEELRASAAKTPAPPADFAVESGASIAARKKEAEFAKANPEVYAWQNIRKRLEAPDGADYFAAELKDKPLPVKLKGTLSRFFPAGKPTELLIGIENPGVEEIVVKLSSAFPNEATPGQVLEIEATGEAFTRDPFVVVVRADRDKIAGWPEPPKR